MWILRGKKVELQQLSVLNVPSISRDMSPNSSIPDNSHMKEMCLCWQEAGLRNPRPPTLPSKCYNSATQVTGKASRIITARPYSPCSGPISISVFTPGSQVRPAYANNCRRETFFFLKSLSSILVSCYRIIPFQRLSL